MDRIKDRDFRLDDLRRHQVWTWDSGELFDEDVLVPVCPNSEALQEASVWLVHSKFTSESGNEFEGLVVFDPDLEDAFALEVFVDGERFAFNRHLPDLSRRVLNRFAEFNRIDAEKVFPLSYKAYPPLLIISPGEFDF